MHKHHHPTNFRGYAPVVIKRWATAVYAAVWRVSIPTAKKCLTCDAFCLTLWKSKICLALQNALCDPFFAPRDIDWHKSKTFSLPQPRQIQKKSTLRAFQPCWLHLEWRHGWLFKLFVGWLFFRLSGGDTHGLPKDKGLGVNENCVS